MHNFKQEGRILSRGTHSKLQTSFEVLSVISLMPPMNETPYQSVHLRNVVEFFYLLLSRHIGEKLTVDTLRFCLWSKRLKNS